MSDTEPPLVPEAEGADTKSAAYTDRLVNLQTVWWKRVLPVQAPFRFNVRRLPLGRTLDIGCGLGRILKQIDGNGVGIDHNPDFVRYCRQAGLVAYTTEEFDSAPEAVPGYFDSLILAHVVEHLDAAVTDAILEKYLPFVRPGGYAHFMTPQELGYRSDPTHIEYVDFDGLHALAERHGLTVVKSYSFPFPRAAGRVFKYNEFNVLTRKP
jgi:2-polyprenyl-3-methyl-5-hydroxy-6-metoxy-1,4-benzoquinol methylase